MDRPGMQGALFLGFLLCSIVVLLVGNRTSVVEQKVSSASTAGQVFPGASKSEMSFPRSSSTGAKTMRLVDADTMRRRLLQSGSSGYIGYGALTGNSVPCREAGNSYYNPNCNSQAGPVSPYTRGCSTITKCARDS